MWDRPTGADGGRVLHWHGKCGLVAGVTPALDQYTQVVSQLGDRFVLLRMPDASVSDFGHAALAHADHETQMRGEPAEPLAGLVEHADSAKVNRPLNDRERSRLVTLAAYTARARTAVARDGYGHDVLYLPQVEGPGRLVKAYARLLGGLEAIGCDSATAWGVLTRIGVDCAPVARTTLMRELLNRHAPARTSDVAAATAMVTKTASRYLEDLSLLGLADHTKMSDADNSPDMWQAALWLREHWPESETEKYPPSRSTYERGEKRHTRKRRFADRYRVPRTFRSYFRGTSRAPTRLGLLVTGRRVWIRPGGRVLAHDPDGWPLPAGHIEATSGFVHWLWGSRTDVWPCHWTHYQQVCQRMAAWRTVEHRGFATWRNFWCDTHLPHRKPAEPPGRTCDVCTGPLDPSLTAHGQTTHPCSASGGNVTLDQAIATITNVFGEVTA